MTTASAMRERLFPLAGIIVGPATWVLTTQLSQILPGWECRSGHAVLLLATSVAVLLSIGSGALSWWGASNLELPPVLPWRFTGRLSALVSFMFAYALFLQAASSLVLSGCER